MARAQRYTVISLSLALALALGAATAPGAIAQGSSAAAATMSPVRATAAAVVYSEDFSAADASGAPIRIDDYMGDAAAAGETYTADAAWSPGANACNGWIMRKGTPIPADGGTPAITNNDECERNDAFDVLGDMAVAMGRFQGMTPAAAADNQVLSEYTNTTSGGQAAGVQLQTTNNSIPAISGHFYAVSGIFAQTNCSSNHARQELALLVNAVPSVVGRDLDPCTDPSAREFVINGANFRVAKFQSHAIQVPPGATAPTLGIRVRNLRATGIGNDVAFDLPQIVDVTPRLSNEFSPSTITQGGATTLTFTVTNTADLMAKNGWSFTDNLPAGLVASGPLGGTCDLTDSAVTGDGVSATGNLARGEDSCTITVQVTSTTAGAYNNSGCTGTDGEPIPNCTNNFPTIKGLALPASTPLTVLPVVALSITKTADATSFMPGEAITYTVTVHNDGPSDAFGATVTDDLPAAITGATWTCAVTAAGTASLPPAGPTTCTTSGAGDLTDTVRINVGGTLTYSVTGVVDASNTSDIENTATVVPAEHTAIPVMPGGGRNPVPGATATARTVDAHCPPAPGKGCSASVTTSGAAPSGTPGLSVVKSADLTLDRNDDGLAGVGDEIIYTFHVTNIGGVTLHNVVVADQMLEDLGLSLTCPPSTLAPGQLMVCTSRVYAVTQVDIDAGRVGGVAVASPATVSPLGIGAKGSGAMGTATFARSALDASPPLGTPRVPPSNLAYTGSSVEIQVALGAVLLIAGAAFLAVSRPGRRRRTV